MHISKAVRLRGFGKGGGKENQCDRNAALNRHDDDPKECSHVHGRAGVRIPGLSVEDVAVNGLSNTSSKLDQT
jgi:hypothetical protein